MRHLAGIILILGFNTVFAQGRIFIPHPNQPETINAVHLKSVDAEINIKDGIANVLMEQRFYNESSVQHEGRYLLSLPKDAQIHDFHLYVNGKKTQGEVLDAKEARRIYEDIVRKSRDPALLEYAGDGLFRTRIFPIAPESERKIELSYTQLLPHESDAYRFVLPIRQSGEGRIEAYHLTLELDAQATIANIYSPSHKIRVDRKGSDRARVSFETSDLQSDKDFVLYYTLSDRDIDFTLFTFRPRTDRDGYFMFLATPVFGDDAPAKIPADFIFVVDVSGSMSGEKIRQAKDALNYCVNSLAPQDRFEIISFSSTVENFQGDLKNASHEVMENARYYIENLRASGGTNIDATLKRALALKPEKDSRPTSIVFLTDGLPTEGEQDIKTILQNVTSQKKHFIRLFSFGIGYDVNTFLLDRLSLDTHGSANYIKPGENIEREVSSFFTKISSPVLSNPEVDFSGLRVYDVYPQSLPDLFLGQQVSIVGRYRGPGESGIQLEGEEGKQHKSFEYHVSFPRRDGEDEFVAKLWANKKVSHLLNQIRFNGENEELVESIKSLGEEYGIVTPYTSYLVREQERELAGIRRDARHGHLGPDALRLEAMQKARQAQSADDDEAVGSVLFYEAISTQAQAPSSASGKQAVIASRILKKVASEDKEINMLLTIRRIEDTTFYFKSGVWVEHGLELESSPIRTIRFLSDEYFDLSRENSTLQRILALGNQVKFKWKGEIISIVE